MMILQRKIAPFGDNSRAIQLLSMHKKMNKHRDSQAHNEVIKILPTAMKDILIIMNTVRILHLSLLPR